MSAEQPSALDDPRTDDTALGMLLAAAHGNARRAMNEGLRPLGIEARLYGVLSAVDREGPVSQRDLTRLLSMDKSAVVRAMDELEQRGLAFRRRSAHDRRAYAIELTEEGRARVRAARDVAAAVGDTFFGRLSTDEREQLAALLSRIADVTPRPAPPEADERGAEP